MKKLFFIGGWLFFFWILIVPFCVKANAGSLIVYPEYDSRIPKCYDYKVTVNQGNRSEELIVYNRNANGEQMSNRCFKPDFDRRFCEFAFTGEVRVDIEVCRDFSTYSVLPSSKEYRNEFHDGVISVWLDKNDTNFMIRLDDDDSTILSVFADAPEEYKFNKNDDTVLYVDEKWYDPNGGELRYTVPEKIKTIYIAPGCVLYSRLLITTNDVTVCGHGMIVDPFGNYYDTQSIGYKNDKMVVRIEGSNVTLKDIKIIDSQNWNIYLFSGYNHLIKNVKILTSRITTDGIAVGSGNVEIDNCFFYVSDNVFTYNGDTGYHNIRNCIVGTTCAAFFLQHRSSNKIDFTDMYVFRANEGIVSNSYNGARIQSDIKHVTFDNLDCVDILHTPWVFKAFDMGDADKYFTFKNCHFANIRGDSNIAAWNQTETQAIYVINNENYLHCSGYRMEFFDCTLDGKPVNDKSAFNPQLTEGNEITFTISNSKPEGKKLNKGKTVNYVYDKKVYIGNYLQPFKNRPVMKDNTVYLPETELCNALNVGIRSETDGIISGSYKYVSLETIQKYYTKASYDSKQKAVRLSAVTDIKTNLLKDFEYTSRWNPYAYPNVILGPYVEKNKTVLRCDVNSNVLYPGMFAEITDDLQKYGKDTYTISFDAKSTDGNSYEGQIRLSNIKYNGYDEIDRDITEKFVAEGKWKKYEIKVNLSDWDTSENALSFIRIGSANTPGYDVLFKNIKMVRTKATKENKEETDVASFAERLYTTCLGRKSEPEGKAYWIDKIMNGTSGAEVAHGFFFSDEFIAHKFDDAEFVTRLYRTFMDREPEKAGFDYWMNILQNGGSREDVFAGFINSNEWADVCLKAGIVSGGKGEPSFKKVPSDKIIAFAERLYTTCLGRQAEPEGLQYWSYSLANVQVSGTQAAYGFFFSDEFINAKYDNSEYVKRLYRTFMNREPEKEGYDYWMNKINKEGMDREEVFYGFADSAEFAEKCLDAGIVRK